MSDNFEFTLHSPLTKEDWNKLKVSDAELENTMSVTFKTPQGRQVRFIKCEVLDKIIAEIERERTFQRTMDEYEIAIGLRKALKIIDKYRESEVQDADSN